MTAEKPLVDRYAPERWGDLQGNNKDIRHLRDWAEDFEPGDEPQMLSGPPGVGKTSTAQVMSNEMGWPIEEVNASDARRTDEIRQVADRMKLHPFDADYQLVVLDEADSIPGTTNLSPLIDVLEDPPNPILIICNDEYEVPKKVRSTVNTLDYSLGSGSIQARIRYIAKQEEADIGPATLSDLADRDNLRDAIQDLQSLIRGEEILEDDREYEANPFDVVENIVRGKKSELPQQFPETPDEFIWWIDENLRDEFRGVEAQVAFDLLARADKWNNRVHHKQNYRWWRTSTNLQKAVADVRLTEPYSGYIKQDYPSSKRKWAPSPTGDTKEAQLYQAMSGDDGRAGVGCGFLEFKEVYIPILQDLPLERRREIANEHGLDGAALRALDLDPDSYEEWRTDEGQKMSETSVFDW